MEQTNQQTTQQDKVKRGHVHEGPKNHIIAFVISIALTFLAFVAVANESLNPSFTIFLLIIMAIIQVVVQLAYWMHMKDRGHLYPVIFLAGGAVVAFTGFIAALYWMWW